jgi:hypothetical protein
LQRDALVATRRERCDTARALQHRVLLRARTALHFARQVVPERALVHARGDEPVRAKARAGRRSALTAEGTVALRVLWVLTQGYSGYSHRATLGTRTGLLWVLTHGFSGYSHRATLRTHTGLLSVLTQGSRAHTASAERLHRSCSAAQGYSQYSRVLCGAAATALWGARGYSRQVDLRRRPARALEIRAAARRAQAADRRVGLVVLPGKDGAHPRHIGTGTGTIPATSAPGLRSPPPQFFGSATATAAALGRTVSALC